MTEDKKMPQDMKVLHSSLIAIMDILVEKGVVSLDELNQKLKETDKEVEKAISEEREII
jgi:hypothetical protein